MGAVDVRLDLWNLAHVQSIPGLRLEVSRKVVRVMPEEMNKGRDVAEVRRWLYRWVRLASG